MKRAMLIALAVLTVPVASASGEVRSGSVSDPRDATPTVSGTPDNPDVREVRMVYDTAGSFTLTVNFYNSINAIDTSSNFAFYGVFDMLYEDPAYDAYDACGRGQASGQLWGGVHDVLHVYVSSLGGDAFFEGYSGSLALSQSFSSDRKSVAVEGKSPILANRDYRCFSYQLYADRHSSISNPDSRYSSACDCWYVSSVIDWAGMNDQTENPTFPVVWFDGFKPEPEPEPAPPEPAPPSNDFGFGTVKKNKRKGTAKLTVKVPGPGEVDLARTKKVKADEEFAETAPGKAKLSVKPKGKARKRLNKQGKTKVKAEVTYTPDGGEPNTRSKRVRLVKR